MPVNRWAQSEGSSSPLGVSWVEEEQAFNFALYSKHATGVTLLLYTSDDVVNPTIQFHLNYLINKSGRIWHCRIPASQMYGTEYYAYQVEGPFDLSEGHRFDPEKILLDPYAKGVFSLKGSIGKPPENLARTPDMRPLESFNPTVSHSKKAPISSRATRMIW